MKNFEKHIDDLSILISYDCGDLECERCPLNNFLVECNNPVDIKKWLLSEYHEPVELSDVERTILENVSENYGFIARDGIYAKLYVYVNRPTWNEWNEEFNGQGSSFNMFKDLFKCIQSGECYKISELLEK